MPDIFLSYSREDQATARRFAEAMEREGYGVWWDVALNPGETFDKVTEQALREAKAVVVLWSKQSVDSRWVRSEATQADRYGKLVPVTIEACERPILFELAHTVDLIRLEWRYRPSLAGRASLPTSGGSWKRERRCLLHRRRLQGPWQQSRFAVRAVRTASSSAGPLRSRQ